MSEELLDSHAEQRQLAYFAGDKYQYYLDKWGPMLRGESTRAGWNWAAFFLGAGWLGYRKMYGATIAYYAVFVVLFAMDEMLDVDTMSTIVSLALAIVFGLYGNAWYLKHARAKIAEVRSRGGDDDTQLRDITAQGGTSLAGTLGLMFLYLLGMGLVYGAYATFGSAY